MSVPQKSDIFSSPKLKFTSFLRIVMPLLKEKINKENSGDTFNLYLQSWKLSDNCEKKKEANSVLFLSIYCIYTHLFLFFFNYKRYVLICSKSWPYINLTLNQLELNWAGLAQSFELLINANWKVNNDSTKNKKIKWLRCNKYQISWVVRTWLWYA